MIPARDHGRPRRLRPSRDPPTAVGAGGPDQGRSRDLELPGISGESQPPHGAHFVRHRPSSGTWPHWTTRRPPYLSSRRTGAHLITQRCPEEALRAPSPRRRPEPGDPPDRRTGQHLAHCSIPVLTPAPVNPRSSPVRSSIRLPFRAHMMPRNRQACSENDQLSTSRDLTSTRRNQKQFPLLYFPMRCPPRPRRPPGRGRIRQVRYRLETGERPGR